MKASRNWLNTFFDKEIPPAKELAELFTFHAFEVEGIEEIKNDSVIDVKILPDRAHYCLSHKGIAEEIHVVTGLPLKKNRSTGVGTEVVVNHEIAVPKITIVTSHAQLDENGLFCRRYMGRRIENVTVGESAPWMKAHLTAIGERSINNIVDATNIVMFDTGQPLHAFDADKVSGDIVVRSAQEGEKITLLDGKEVVLKAIDHVIADDAGPLAIAGVKGGKRAQVTASTKSIVVESANFNPTAVRRTSTRLNLRNESSKRFENEITPELAAEGMSMVSALIAELIPDAAGHMSDIVDIYPAKPSQTVISVNLSYINDRLGADVPAATYQDILSRLGISVSGDGSMQSLTIPYHRLDLAIPEDVVEEVGRIYGYDKIKTQLPPASAKGIDVLPSFYLAEKIKNILTAQGFSEVNLYTLVAKGEIETAYPLASDKSFARKNLSDGMLVCLEKNTQNADLLGVDAIKIFEIGRTFTNAGEFMTLSIGATQVKKNKQVKGETIIMAALETLNKELAPNGASVPLFSGKIISKGIHFVCEINLNDVLKAYELPASVSYADLDLAPASSILYKKFSVYPFIVRDIAVFVPEDVQATEIWSVIEKSIASAGATSLLTRHSLFDTFKKDGRTSFAFRMIFQSMEKTLTDEEISKVMDAVYADIKAKSWEVR